MPAGDGGAGSPVGGLCCHALSAHKGYRSINSFPFWLCHPHASALAGVTARSGPGIRPHRPRSSPQGPRPQPDATPGAAARQAGRWSPDRDSASVGDATRNSARGTSVAVGRHGSAPARSPLRWASGGEMVERKVVDERRRRSQIRAAAWVGKLTGMAFAAIGRHRPRLPADGDLRPARRELRARAIVAPPDRHVARGEAWKRPATAASAR